MKWTTLKYLCKEGILGLWKNRLMALASAGTIILCLLILGMSYSIGENITHVLQQVEAKLGITAYIAQDTTDERIEVIRKAAEELPNVTKVHYISKEEALQAFAKDQENDAIFEQFVSDNPLPASIEIQVSSLEAQGPIVARLNKIPELQVSYFEKETDMFMKVNKSIKLVSGVIIACLIVIGLLLISNTIKLTVYVRRKEINIMKYIGATDWFIRLPFLIEGFLIGLIGSVISMGIIYGIYNWLVEFLEKNLANMLGGITLVVSVDIMSNLVILFGLIGCGIGLMGSGIAIRKHLKV